MQALPVVHETASNPPCCPPGGKPGDGSSDHPTPSHRSAKGTNTGTVCMALGSYNTLWGYSPTATQTLLDVHETPARGLSPGTGSGVACSRQLQPSQPIASIPPADPASPTATHASADAHDTDETRPGNGVGWTDQTRPRAEISPS